MKTGRKFGLQLQFEIKTKKYRNKSVEIECAVPRSAFMFFICRRKVTDLHSNEYKTPYNVAHYTGIESSKVK